MFHQTASSLGEEFLSFLFPIFSLRIVSTCTMPMLKHDCVAVSPLTPQGRDGEPRFLCSSCLQTPYAVSAALTPNSVCASMRNGRNLTNVTPGQPFVVCHHCPAVHSFFFSQVNIFVTPLIDYL